MLVDIVYNWQHTTVKQQHLWAFSPAPIKNSSTRVIQCNISRVNTAGTTRFYIHI